MDTGRPHIVSDNVSLPEPSLQALVERVAAAAHLRVLLDYDGTLVPMARSPELAAPDADLLGLLADLAVRRGVRIELVSGRSHRTLDKWFGHLPVSLWAEHGFWHRPAQQSHWGSASPVPLDWMPPVRWVMQWFKRHTPGSHVECKTISLAWHYRRTPPAFGAYRAHELRTLLDELLSHEPCEVLEGRKVIEVRPFGINKARAASRIGAEECAHAHVIAIGDDRTDEDLFRALPPDAITIAVGDRPSSARYRLPDHVAVRQILESLACDPRTEVKSAGPQASRLGTQ